MVGGVVVLSSGRHISRALCLDRDGSPEVVYACLEEMDRNGIPLGIQEYRALATIASALDPPGESHVRVLAAPASITAADLSALAVGELTSGFFVVDRSGREIRVRPFVKADGEPAQLRELAPREVAAERRREWTVARADRWGRRFNGWAAEGRMALHRTRQVHVPADLGL
jgi:hypothetical protein